MPKWVGMGRLNCTAVVVLLTAIALLAGPRLRSAWYSNLGAHALVEEWGASRQPSRTGACQRWSADSPAAPLVAQALRLNPQNDGARLNAGRVAWLLGDCEAALLAWSSLESGDAIANLERANGLHALGREEEALLLYQKLDGATDYLRMQGEVAEAAHNQAAAVGWYELDMGVLPTLTTAENLARLYLGMGKRDAVTAVWRRLSESTHEADPVHWWALGKSAELQYDWETAARAYDHGAEMSNDACRFWEQQEAALEELGAWARAEGVAREALGACPERLWPYLQLGGLRFQQGDSTGAVYWYGQAEVRSPEDVNPKYRLGLLYYQCGQYERAEAYFQQVLTLDPRHAWSLHRLAWCLHDRHEMHRAVEALSRAIEQHPGQPWEWVMQLGDWQLDLGHRQEALSAYRQALLWNPGDAALLERIECAEQLTE